MLRNISYMIRRYFFLRQFRSHPTISKLAPVSISYADPDNIHTGSIREWRPGLLAGSIQRVD